MSKSLPEVNFNENVNVQVTYKQNVYDTKILYSSCVLTIIFCDSDSLFDGMTYTINSENCQIAYNGITYDLPVNNLPKSFLPLVLYKFISEFNGVIPTESYDSDKMCSGISRKVFNSDVILEVYENENNLAYSLHIT